MAKKDYTGKKNYTTTTTYGEILTHRSKRNREYTHVVAAIKNGEVYKFSFCGNEKQAISKASSTEYSPYLTLGCSIEVMKAEHTT